MLCRTAARSSFLGLALLTSCAHTERRGVMLTLNDAGVSPSSIELIWLNGEGVIFRRRIPESGSLRPEGAKHITVFIEAAQPSGARRLIARASLGKHVDAEGTARFDRVGDGVISAELTLRSGALPDADHDGIPDEVDDCPGVANVKGECPDPYPQYTIW